MAKEKIRFEYDKDTHMTICYRTIRNKEYIGVTICNEADYDFESQHVGEHYAYVRACLQEIREKRDWIRAQITIVRHILDLMYQSGETENKGLMYRQLKALQKEYAEQNKAIAAVKASLKEEMNSRDILHNKLIENRKQGKTLTSIFNRMVQHIDEAKKD